MIPVFCHRNPFASHFTSCRQIRIRYFPLSQHSGHLAVAGYPHDRFDGQVGVVSEMTGEIVRA